jgi:hypothetical protein
MMIVRFGHVGIPHFWKITSSPLCGVNSLAALHGTELPAGPPWCLTGMSGGVGGASYPDYTIVSIPTRPGPPLSLPFIFPTLLSPALDPEDSG